MSSSELWEKKEHKRVTNREGKKVKQLLFMDAVILYTKDLTDPQKALRPDKHLQQSSRIHQSVTLGWGHLPAIAQSVKPLLEGPTLVPSTHIKTSERLYPQYWRDAGRRVPGACSPIHQSIQIAESQIQWENSLKIMLGSGSEAVPPIVKRLLIIHKVLSSTPAPCTT